MPRHPDDPRRSVLRGLAAIPALLLVPAVVLGIIWVSAWITGTLAGGF